MKSIFQIIIVLLIGLSIIENVVGNELLSRYESMGAIVDEDGGEVLIDFDGIKKLNDGDLKSINSLTMLTRFSASKTSITDVGISYLATNSKIDSIHADSTRITGRGFKNFRNSKITLLSLNKSFVDDEGLQYICELKELQELSLGGTRITDNGLKLIAKMPKLKSFVASSNTTDLGMQYLAESRSLRYVMVAGSKVTKIGIDFLKSKIPNCEIESNVLK